MGKKKLIPAIILLFLSLWAVWPLLRSGFIPTHDGEYHLIRFWQFDKNIRSGNFFPRWAPDLDHGFGVPLFCFFYPFPNYPAEFFHLLGSSFIGSFKLSLATAFVLSGGFFYLWLKNVFGPWPALVSAVFYLFAPYHFLDVYVRGSIGEVWALVWLPAVLWALEKKSVVLAGSFFALLILSHNILALIFTPFLLSYMAFLTFIQFPKKKEFIIYYPLSVILLGLGLSCYFWLPALMESRYVAGLGLVNFADHFPALFQLIFPSWGTGFSVAGILDGMSFQIGLANLLVVFLAILLLLKSKLKSKIGFGLSRKRAVFFLGWFFFLVILLLEVSLPFWKIMPLMKYIQYPWRLLSLIIAIVSFLAGWLAKQLKVKAFLAFLLLLPVLIGFRYSRPVVYSPRKDSFYLENPTWTQGTDTLANSFNTIWAKQHFSVRQRLKTLKGRAEIKEVMIGPADYKFQVQALSKAKLKVNTNYFPGWQVKVDNHKTKMNLEKDGSFSFDLLKGDHSVGVQFRETALRLLADSLSVLSFLVLIVKMIK